MSVRVAQLDADLSGEQWTLDAAAVHYLTVVRRLGEGAEFALFTGDGASRQAQLVCGADGWTARFCGPLKASPWRPDVTLCYGLPKGDKLDRVVRQVTELGVTGVKLIACQRSVTRLSGDRARKRIARLARVAQEAARQCGRSDVPTIEGPLSLDAALGGRANRLVLHPEGGQMFEKMRLQAPVEVYVGPEGGFSPDELARFDAAGATRARLLSPVLRTETAAPVACALVLHRLGVL
jgi:16S rRNA (uracil1498-N3)-methyltransferase